MKARPFYLVLIMLGLVAGRMPLAAQGTAFTYQGRLSNGGSPANGLYDFTFGLYPTNSGGVATGLVLTNSSVAVSNGLFLTTLDFGPVFDGTAYWLEIGVQLTDSTNGFNTLSPRQQLSSTPYSVYALNAGAVSGVLDQTNLPANVVLLNNSPVFTGSVTASGFYGDGSALSNITASVNITNVITNYDKIQVTNGVTVSSGASAYTIQQRLGGSFPFPVVAFRPAQANTPLAFDLMPNMTGANRPSYDGLISWMDICDTDCITNTPPLSSAHIAVTTNHVEYSSMGYYGGPAKPIWFEVGGAPPVMTLSNGYGAYVKSSAVGGVTLDGSFAPAYVMATNGAIVGYFGAATASNQWFYGSVPGDVALRAESGERILIGIGPYTQAPVLIINADGNVSIGTNISSAKFSVSGNVSIAGSTAVNGLASYATNVVAAAGSSGWTNTWGINAYVNIAGASGSYVFYNRSGTGGTNVCGTALFTNSITPGGSVVPVPVNCGVAVVGEDEVAIQAYAQ